MKEFLDYKLRVISIEEVMDDLKEEFNKLPYTLDDETEKRLSEIGLTIIKLMEELRVIKSIINDKHTYCRKYSDLNDCTEHVLRNSTCDGCVESVY